MQRCLIVILFLISFWGTGGCYCFQKGKCEALEQSIYLRCQKILIEGLHSESFWSRMHAAEGLTETKNSKMVLQLLPTMLAAEEDDQKRCGLARELVRAGDESKVSVLTRILSNPESNGRIHAAESLFKVQRIGDLELMIKCATDNDNSKVQLWACAALIRTGHKEYLSVLRRFLDGTDPLDRALSAYLLGQLGDKSEAARIKKDLEQVSEPLHSFYYTVGIICMDGSDTMGKLQTYLNCEDKTICALSAYTAGSELICSCQQKLIALLDDSVEDVCIRSAHALLNMNMLCKSTSVSRRKGLQGHANTSEMPISDILELNSIVRVDVVKDVSVDTSNSETN